MVLLDDFRVRGRPFGPHPQAGFAAVTYVFADSLGDLRSRTSLGNDLLIGPGGICWTQAGHGVVHEEIPARPDRELHGLQIFVNLSARNKLAEPQVLRLPGSEVPEWRSGVGDLLRVVVGSFQEVSSPLVPAESFNLLDIELQRKISVSVADGHNALAYVVTGGIVVRADGREEKVAAQHAIAIYEGPETSPWRR